MKVIKDEMSLSAKLAASSDSASSTTMRTVKSPFAVSVQVRSSVNKRLVEAFTAFTMEAAKKLGISVSSGPASLPPSIFRWTVLSSPFVHKTARTQLERREHEKAVQFEGIWNEEICAKFLWYLKRHVPNEVELILKVTERVPWK